MSVVRPHRFPPLSQLAQGAPLPSTRSGSDQVQWQHAVAEGFQQGFDKGYQEGLSSGQTQGHQAGLANGYEEGRQQGQAAARSEARAQLEGLAAPLDKAAAELTQLLGDYQSALRKEVVELVAKVARQVIRCELALQPTQLLSLVDEALSVMPATPERVDIYLNPEECQRIKELAPERLDSWHLIPDAQLEPGECRVHAGDQEVDAGCRQRLAACMAQVEAQLQEHPETEATAS